MKSRVDISTYSIIISILLVVVLAACTYLNRNDTFTFILCISVLILLLIPSLWFCPISISATTTELKLNSPLHRRTIKMDSIESVIKLSPTMGAKRLLGSGGFLGYWGKFRESDIGKYYAFHGKSSDCFMVTLKDDKKFVLGCKNPQAMTDYINGQIK